MSSILCIFKTRIDNIPKSAVLAKISSFLRKKDFHYIITLNPEILLLARSQERFRAILNASDLNIVDGIGIKFAFWRYREYLKSRCTGADIMWDILEIADRRGLKVFLLANKDGLSTWEETKNNIKKVYPNLKINGKNSGINDEVQIDDIDDSEILFVNFGAPYQEEFISKFKNVDTSLKIGIGVGGSFDYITGKVSRAPYWMRKIGFEWLYRLIKQPKRLKRIWNAVFKFPFLILFTKKDRQCQE